MSVKTKVITVTPRDAERLLKNMVNNRQPNERHITFLAQAMKRGEWDVTGQPIIISESNKLLDGQHRMRAVLASKCTVQMLAVYGIKDSFFSKMDQGRARGISDCIGSIANKHDVAAVIRLVYAEKKSDKGSKIHATNYKPTNDEALDILRSYPGIVNAASFCTKYKRARRMASPSALSYCLFRMRQDNETEADLFIQRMDTGEGLSKRSPLLSLRNQLIDGKRIDGINCRWNVVSVITGMAVAWYMTLNGINKPIKIDSCGDLWTGWRTNL